MTEESATSILLQLLTQRYGDRLSPEQWAEVKQGIEGAVQQVEALRAVPLQNSDEPFTCFQPYCGEGPRGKEHTA